MSAVPSTFAGMSEIELAEHYDEILATLKQQVRGAHLRAHRSVNTELITLYWRIGRTILEQQRQAGWGGKVVERLAHDLRREFPEMTGLSRSNLMYMQRFAESWSEECLFVPQAVGQISPGPVMQLPWGEVRTLLDKLSDHSDRDWYAARAADEGWSRAVLEHNIMGQLRQREGAAPSSFDGQLEQRDARLAQAISKDPYVFDFLGLGAEAAERDLEQAMMDRLVDVLRELGPGWAFVDRQKHIEIGGDDFSLDCSDSRIIPSTREVRRQQQQPRCGRSIGSRDNPDQAVSPQSRRTMSSRSCHIGTAGGLVVPLPTLASACRFISVSACA